VVIKWQTAQEENVSGFEIQSSCNGTDWKVISTLPAKGNASVSQSYNYSDATSLINANSNTLYYRLRIVDKDGSYQYSGVKSLQLKLSPFVVAEPVTFLLPRQIPGCNSESSAAAAKPLSPPLLM